MDQTRDLVKEIFHRVACVMNPGVYRELVKTRAHFALGLVMQITIRKNDLLVVPVIAQLRVVGRGT